jgi:cell division protease FtsH
MTRLNVIYLVCFGLAVIIGVSLFQASSRLPQRAYSQFLTDIADGNVLEVTIRGGEVSVTDSSGGHYATFAPDEGALLERLQDTPITIQTRAPSELSTLFKDMLIVLLLLGGWFIFSKTGSTSGKFTSNKSIQYSANNQERVTFEDVAGISEARDELKEIIDFLKQPVRFSRLGGRIPKGVLLEGPPGTGKTLLARAIAGEASVPFFSIGGSDFVEMFAGLGASRVRKLFAEAKKQAPCIIFIDEIDAIGGKRSVDYRSGSSDEREQTLNALLVEMDGFQTSETIIVIAATNRSDILDSALLRPGRFDRRITLTLPDIKERMKILRVHAAKTIIDSRLDLSLIARGIPGFSGAEIANLVNEAALLAARRGKVKVEQVDFEDAQDKITMGLERRNAVISQEARRLTAYHEAGHAVVAKLLPETDPLHKITIIPRGQSLGLTQQLPIDEHLTYAKSYLLNRIMILLAGRCAEEAIFGRLTTGASNDLLSATRIAHRLVCEFGMSDRLGPVACSGGAPGEYAQQSSTGWLQSQQTMREIDMEIRGLISDCNHQAKKLITDNSEFLHMLAESLLANETLDGEEVDIIYRCYLDRRRTEQASPEEN